MFAQFECPKRVDSGISTVILKRYLVFEARVFTNNGGKQVPET